MDDGIYEDDYTYYYDEEEDINKTSHDDDPALAIVPEDELKFISINDTVDELTAPLVNFSMKSDKVSLVMPSEPEPEALPFIQNFETDYYNIDEEEDVKVDMVKNKSAENTCQISRGCRCVCEEDFGND